MLLSRTGASVQTTTTTFFTHHVKSKLSGRLPATTPSFLPALVTVDTRFSSTAMSETEASGSTAVEQSTAEEAAKTANDQPGTKGIGTDKELGRLAVPIMPHLLNLYNCEATALDFDIYAPNATFEDPLMCAKGVKQIKSAFYAIPKVFSDGKMGEYFVQENETAPGAGEIRIDGMQHYKVWGQAIDMRSLIKIEVRDGKVIRHEDLWDKNPLWTKQNVRVPLVGRAAEAWRRFNMLVTHVLMGFGKDPRPKH